MDGISGSWIPKKISKYEILSKLGQGAMGIVYKGFDPLIQREVALKTIRKDFLRNQDIDLEMVLYRFRMEAQASGRLNHPNIVSIYEFDEDDDTFFIAMEIVTGRELKDYFNNNERFISMAMIADILYQLLDALAHSHKRGVIHRDIKPANIIIMKNHQIKVADFGIASVETSSEHTQIGSILGTPGYMSPEQIQGDKVDARSDLFSVGVILYQFLTGEKPFDGHTLPTLMHKILTLDPTPPSQLNASIPAALDAVVMKAIAKDPADRFQSATEFSSAIKHGMEGKDKSERRNIPSPNVMDEQPQKSIANDATLMTTSTAVTSHSKRFLLIAIVFIGVLAIGAIVFFKSDSFFDKISPVIQPSVTAPQQDKKAIAPVEPAKKDGLDQQMKPMATNKPEDVPQVDIAAKIPEKKKTENSLQEPKTAPLPKKKKAKHSSLPTDVIVNDKKEKPKRPLLKTEITVPPENGIVDPPLQKSEETGNVKKTKAKRSILKTKTAKNTKKVKEKRSLPKPKKPAPPARKRVRATSQKRVAKKETAINEVETTDVLKFIEALQKQAEQQ